jgi:6-phosphofructokinase 1
MSELVGNMLIAQSGGPTCAINASVAGAIEEAGRHPDLIEEIYGGRNGIYGILREQLIDLQEERRSAIEGLRYTPAAALGTCRYKIDFKKKPEQAARDMDRLFEVFRDYNIRYFFYAGGNDSQDTSLKIHEEALRRGWDLRVIGIPKTIDNDLPHTDHCPGYGSVIKYNATTVMEVGMDVASMATDDGSVCIIEVMGRSAGWIAAGTALAKRGNPAAPPHLILLPELVFEKEPFLARVREVVNAHKYCIVVVGEGIKWKVKRTVNGVEQEVLEEVGADPNRVDAFGHKYLSGAALKLKDLVEAELKTKTRTVLLGYAQRAAAHCASATDIENAVACGRAAVRAAVDGQSGYMVKITREYVEDDTGARRIRWGTALHDLRDVANVEHFVPRDWLTEDGMMVNEKFIEYAAPLIEGEVRAPIEHGLPKYVVLEGIPAEKKMPEPEPAAAEPAPPATGV